MSKIKLNDKVKTLSILSTRKLLAIVVCYLDDLRVELASNCENSSISAMGFHMDEEDEDVNNYVWGYCYD